MILSNQKCCLLLTGVSTESQNVTLYFRQSRLFSNKKYDSYKCWTCAELCEALNFRMQNTYVQFEGHGLSTNSGDFLWAQTVLHS